MKSSLEECDVSGLFEINLVDTPFRKASKWKTPLGHPCLEVFLSQVEKEIFSLPPGKHWERNLTREEMEAVTGLADDTSIVIKPAIKGLVWLSGIVKTTY